MERLLIKSFLPFASLADCTHKTSDRILIYIRFWRILMKRVENTFQFSWKLNIDEGHVLWKSAQVSALISSKTL
jgi:hypothetical protein